MIGRETALYGNIILKMGVIDDGVDQSKSSWNTAWLLGLFCSFCLPFVDHFVVYSIHGTWNFNGG